MRAANYAGVFALAAFVAVGGGSAQPVGSEFRVNTYTTSGQDIPSVCSDSTGNFVVVWNSYRQDGSDRGVFGQRYLYTGAPVGPEFRVNTYTTGVQFGLSIACDSTGDFVVVWQSHGQDGAAYSVFTQRYSSSGTPWATEFRVSTYTTSNQGGARVSLDFSGNFVVVWQDYIQLTVLARRFSSSGAALGPEFSVNSPTPGVIHGSPSVSSDPLGNFVVVWRDYDIYTFFGVLAQRYSTEGSPLGAAFRVDTTVTGPAGFGVPPGISSDSTGNFVVVWENYGVFGQRFSSSGTQSGPQFQVAGCEAWPSVAADSLGNFIATCGSQSGSLAQRYNRAGTALGSAVQVNGTAVASDYAGNFVVLGTASDGSSVGIFGQRFARIDPAGDVNGDGLVNVLDVFYLINYLFAGGPTPIGYADVDGDGIVDVLDVFHLINYVFAGGPAPK
jgi:hypothetical protein